MQCQFAYVYLCDRNDQLLICATKMSQFFQLNDGRKMPAVGLGTGFPTGDEDKDVAVYEAALAAGYRHFDTAYAYKNETILGKALENWLTAGKVKREELFIVTKLPAIGMTPEKVNYFLEKDLKALRLDYVDMYLIHSPIGMVYENDDDVFPTKDGKSVLDMKSDFIAVWNQMEEQVRKGLTKSIGISNFNCSQIERLMKVAKIPPANLQVEMNAYFLQKPLHEVCKKYGIVLTAFSALGTPGRSQMFKAFGGIDVEERGLIDDSVVVSIAKKHGKLTSQTLLRFLVQLGVNVIPRSSNPSRLQQNLNIFDFTLTNDDMQALKKLDQGLQGRGYADMFEKMMAGHPEYQIDQF